MYWSFSPIPKVQLAHVLSTVVGGGTNLGSAIPVLDAICQIQRTNNGPMTYVGKPNGQPKICGKFRFDDFTIEA